MQLAVFGIFAAATAVLAISIENLHVGVAALVPVAYAASEGLTAPYPNRQSHALIGIVSIASYSTLVAAVAISTPSSNLFDAAWYGYVAASVLYALFMWSAPRRDDGGWMGLLHWYSAYLTLISAIAFSCAVAVRVVTEEDDSTASGLAVTGAILSIVLDGYSTAGWFFEDENRTFVARGRLFGVGFVIAFAGLFGSALVTSIAGIVAGAMMLILEFAAPVIPKIRTCSLIIRSVPLLISIVSVWVPHVYGLVGAGGTAGLALVTAAELARMTVSKDSLLMLLEQE